jgi:glycine dehydrogenase
MLKFRLQQVRFQSTKLSPLDTFVRRHVGPSEKQVPDLLKTVGVDSMKSLIQKTIPNAILNTASLGLGAGITERELLVRFKAVAQKNKVFKSYIGMGYHDTVVPAVIQRNILESPGWYTQYTPYQAEISQGRLESLINYQTMVSELTGLDIANASLLDEGTAAAEAMLMAFSANNRKKKSFVVDSACHPQTIACVQTRAQGFGIKVVVADATKFDFRGNKDVFGALLQVSLVI